MPVFQLTFNGVPFCLDDPEIIEFVEQNIPLEDLRETILPENPTTGAWAKNLSGIALPYNPLRAKLEIGRFFYPTGLARWGQFHGLMKSSQLKQLEGKLYQSNGSPNALPFIIQAETPTVVTGGVHTPMFMLPPRYLGGWGSSVNSQGKSPFDELWLVTLVDERYYNSYKAAGKITPDGNLLWDYLISQLTSILGITLNPALPPIETVYGKPAQDSPLWSMYESAAYLLQACLENVGRVSIRNYDGTYQFPKIVDVMNQALAAPVSPVVQKLAGGDMFYSVFNASRPNLEIPQLINVTFPKFIAGQGYVDMRDPLDKNKPSYGDVWLETVSLGQAGPPWASYGGVGTKTLHDTARGCYASFPGYNCCQAIAGFSATCCYFSNGTITFVSGGPCPGGGSPGPCPAPGSVCCFNADGSFTVSTPDPVTGLPTCPSGTLIGNCPQSVSNVYAPAGVNCPSGTVPVPLGNNCPTIPAGSQCCFYPDGTFITILQGSCPQGTQPGACPPTTIVQNTASPPANQPELRVLAVQISQNYLANLQLGLDIVLPGIFPWNLDGMNDLLFTYRGNREMASTRIFRKPWNYGAVEFQHDFFECGSVNGNCCQFSDGSTVLVPSNWPCPPGSTPVPLLKCQSLGGTGTGTGGGCQQCCRGVSLSTIPPLILVGCGQPCPSGYAPVPLADCQGGFGQQTCCVGLSPGLGPPTVVVPFGQPCPFGYVVAPMIQCLQNLPGNTGGPGGSSSPPCFNFQDSCTIGWFNYFLGASQCLNVTANFKGIYVCGFDTGSMSPGTLINFCGTVCDGTFNPPCSLLQLPPIPNCQCCQFPSGAIVFIPGGSGCPIGSTMINCGNLPGGITFPPPGATCCFYPDGSFVWTFGKCPAGTTPEECPGPPNNPCGGTIGGGVLGIDLLNFNPCDFNVKATTGQCLGGATINTQGPTVDFQVLDPNCNPLTICIRDGLVKGTHS